MTTRRNFLQHSVAGLAAIGVSGLVLRSDALPTIPIIGEESSKQVLIQMGPILDEPAKTDFKKIAPFPYGPWYKPGAPFRGKLSVPGEPGTTFILSGRAWSAETRRPLPGVVLDFWHVDLKEKYSNGVTDFRNRGRLVTTESGYYELESIRPIPYRPNPAGDFWRCAHFHVAAICPGYKPLITEIQFQEEPKKTDSMYQPLNAIATQKHTANGSSYESGVFDLVLERETR
jgi:catechol 1,2-dioxygenase